MYTPRQFGMAEADAIRLVNQYPFGLLISTTDGELHTTHVPFLLSEDATTLTCHVARANPHWQQLPCTVTAVFNGPDHYISPNWYAAADQVPTWNYEAVHITGDATTFDDAASLEQLVADLSANMEAGFNIPWTMDKLSDRTRVALLRAIVGIRIDIQHMDGKSKFSQNKPDEIGGIISALTDAPGESAATAMARRLSGNQI